MKDIRFEGVGKAFATRSGGRFVALDDVSLTVAEREFVAVVAPSGSAAWRPGTGVFIHRRRSGVYATGSPLVSSRLDRLRTAPRATVKNTMNAIHSRMAPSK